MTRALVIVDIQNDYFPGGRNPLEGPEQAAANARELLDGFRASGEPLVHIQHAWDAPDAEYLQPGTPASTSTTPCGRVRASPSSRRRTRTASWIRRSRSTCATGASIP